MVRKHESHLSVASHEEEDDERIGYRYDECCHAIVDERSLLAAYMDILRRITAEAIESEDEEQDTTEYLEVETVLVVGYEIHYETHYSETGQQCVNDIAYSCTHACYETVSATFVQGALNA